MYSSFILLLYHVPNLNMESLLHIIFLEAAPHKTAAIRPPTTRHETIKVRWTRHAGHCWRSRDELIIDVLLWTPSQSRAKAGRPARAYIQQRCEDMGCSPEDRLEAMNDWVEWRERVRDICAGGMTRWWGWFFFWWKPSICLTITTPL